MAIAKVQPRSCLDVKCVSELDDSAKSFFARGAALQWSDGCVNT
jgi:hypothetical protein